MRLSRSDSHTVLRWQGPRHVLSSAVLNGGLAETECLLNMRVDGSEASCSPEQSLAELVLAEGLPANTVGMMTSASLNSCRLVQQRWRGGELWVLLSSGLSNARCAGDPSDWREPLYQPGTINTAIITSLQLSLATQLELLSIATQAQTVALREAGIRSAVSDALATGTGTDATALVTAPATSSASKSAASVRWAGLHTELAEVLSVALIEALSASIARRPIRPVDTEHYRLRGFAVPQPGEADLQLNTGPDAAIQGLR